VPASLAPAEADDEHGGLGPYLDMSGDVQSVQVGQVGQVQVYRHQDRAGVPRLPAIPSTPLATASSMTRAKRA
jgi:hypothetical protein